jgi:hypothetical protein
VRRWARLTEPPGAQTVAPSSDSTDSGGPSSYPWASSMAGSGISCSVTNSSSPSRIRSSNSSSPSPFSDSRRRRAPSPRSRSPSDHPAIDLPNQAKPLCGQYELAGGDQPLPIDHPRKELVAQRHPADDLDYPLRVQDEEVPSQGFPDPARPLELASLDPTPSPPCHRRRQWRRMTAGTQRPQRDEVLDKRRWELLMRRAGQMAERGPRRVIPVHPMRPGSRRRRGGADVDARDAVLYGTRASGGLIST